MWILICSTVVLATITLLIFRWLQSHYWYWSYQKLPYIPNSSLFGNVQDIVLYKNSAAEVLQDLYQDKRTENEPIVGMQIFHQPGLLVRDLELVKRILVKDFNYFSNRYSSSDPHSDSIGSYNLFFVKNPIWRQIRNHITPIFTSGKMKHFFHLINDVGKNLDKHLNELPMDPKTNSTCQNVREICSLYTTDVIASVAFGVEANSLKNPESDFRKNGRHIFNFTLWRAFEFNAFFFIPKLVSIFRCKVFSAKSTIFLRSTFNYIIEEREKSKQIRNDLIDLLIGIRNANKLQIDNKGIKFDGDILVSQAAFFFTAGYETTSSTMSFGLYELAKDFESQKRLRQEIKEVLEMNNGEISYDIILNMRFINMVILEILRLYPPLPFLDRQVDLPKGESKGYSLEPISDFIIPDQMPVYIPIYAMQRDEKYFPNPDKFDPERFAPENKDNIVPYSYMPFGSGGRVCIGERLGLMQAKIGLFNFFKNHHVKLSANTPKVMKLEPKALIIQSKGGIYCDIIRDSLIK